MISCNTPHGSNVPSSIVSGVATTIPDAPISKVTSFTIQMGSINSRTSTNPSEVQTLPESSVAVKTTGFNPTSSQEKAPGVIEKARSSSQLSVLPSSTNLPGSGTVISIKRSTKAVPEIQIGAMVSRTVTSEVQVLVLPATSVTVRTTAFMPKFWQSKELKSIEVVTSVQKSLLPLSTSDGIIDTSPASSRYTVISCTIHTGGVTSGAHCANNVLKCSVITQSVIEAKIVFI